VENNRSFPRTRLRAEVKLNHPTVGEQRAHTRDISEGGAYVLNEGLTLPALGEIIEVQVQGLPGDSAPVVRMKVVRIDREGIGLEFLKDGE
jgi:c-di-GMP-binding flagellar brake protein YcgR